MFDHGNEAYLRDMQEFAGMVMVYLKDRTREDFLFDRQLRDAVAYNLQVVGEAAFKVSNDFKDMHPEVDRFKIIGLRHRIVLTTGVSMMRRFGGSRRSMCHP